MGIAEKYLKFRAALAEWWGQQRVVPDRNGIVKQYTDLELKIRTGGHYGGSRAVFITDLAAMEDELLELREYRAAMRREEEVRTAIRRSEAVAHSRRASEKLDEQDQ